MGKVWIGDTKRQMTLQLTFVSLWSQKLPNNKKEAILTLGQFLHIVKEFTLMLLKQSS